MKRQRNGWKIALVLVGLATLAVLVMDFNSRMAELRRLSAEKEVVAGRLADQEQTKTVLETQIVEATSEQSVLRWAYEDGHMVRPGDNPVVPLSPADHTPAPTATPVVVQTQTSNLQAWISLFLGPPTERGAP